MSRVFLLLLWHPCVRREAFPYSPRGNPFRLTGVHRGYWTSLFQLLVKTQGS